MVWEGFLLLPGEEVEPAGMFAVLDEFGIIEAQEGWMVCRWWLRLVAERGKWWREQAGSRQPGWAGRS